MGNIEEAICELIERGQREGESRAECFLQAATLVVKHYAGDVLNRCRKCLPDLADAEEVAQEALLSIYKSFPTYNRDVAPFLAWIRTITNHRIADFYRKHSTLEAAKKGEQKRQWRIFRTKRSQSLQREQRVSPQEKQAELSRMISWQSALVERALQELSWEEQFIIRAHKRGKYSPQELAEALNKTPANIRQMSSRAISKLAAAVARLRSEEDKDGC
jgi:RNA polymerase sigma-70 factor (ECF subfamily)